MQTQATPSSQDILQQFSDMLKSHSIIVSDRENLIKLFENIIELCTQMPKTKIKAAVKAAKEPAKEPKAKPTKPTPKPKKSVVATVAPMTQELVGPAEAGDCPMPSDLKPAAAVRGRGRPRKDASVHSVHSVVNVTVAPATTPAGDAEKKKRGRPKKDKLVTISSNQDEDALIAKMIADVKSMKKDEYESGSVTDESELEEFTGVLMRAEETTPVAIADADDDETDSEEESEEKSVSPIHTAMVESEVQIQVEADVLPDPPATTKVVKGNKGKASKEPKAKEPKAKEPKAKEPKAKEPKAKEPKVKEPKVKESKATEPKAKEPKAKEPKVVEVLPELEVELENVNNISVEPVSPHAPVISYVPVRENKASSDGKFYLMSNFPRVSFSHSGKTYFRTETDNVYDNMTLELIGVWDHLNHEIISSFDDEEEIEELWFSDEE